MAGCLTVFLRAVLARFFKGGNHMKEKGMIISRSETGRISTLILASFIYAIGINGFLLSGGLYTGGLLGLCQVLITLLKRIVPISLGTSSASSVLYYLVNVPFLFLAHKLMGRRYFVKTIVAITAEAVFLALIPVPKDFIQNSLTSALVGGGICGAMMGLILRMGACDGGMDLVGVLLVHQKNGASVGLANLAVNIVVFAAMLIHNPLEVLLYSLIGAIATSFCLDRMYSQNIDVEVHIILQKDPKPLGEIISRQLRRSATIWDGTGSYSGQEKHIFYVVVDKYEIPRLRRLTREYDPEAFVIENSGVNIQGNFEKHLT
jgi:uncharacterized membrane-anchored protein YitT (DUF2179 family)